jgi:hypothetical protein
VGRRIRKALQEMRTLTPFKDGKYIPVEEALKQLEEYIPLQNQRQSVNDTVSHGNELIIQDFSDRYRLRNVVYNGELWVFDWLKGLLGNGSEHSQVAWLSYTRDADVKLPNSRMLYANVAALHANRNHPVIKTLVETVVDDIFKPDITMYYPHTSTRIAYQPAGQGKVIHNFSYTDQEIIHGDIWGPSATVDANSGLEKPINAILGTTNLAEVEQVYTWLSGQKPVLLRLQEEPQVGFESVVAFGLNDKDNRFYINADCSDNGRPVRGVIARKVETK